MYTILKDKRVLAEQWKQILADAVAKLDISGLPECGVVDSKRFQETYQNIADHLVEDFQTLYGAYDVLFDDYREMFGGANGAKLADLFQDWRDAERAPSICSILLAISDQHDIDQSSSVFQAALLTGIAADIKLNNPYHDNNHFREVVAATVRIINTNNELSANNVEGVLWIGPQTAAKALLAAAGHDLNHDGTGNSLDGEHQQYRLEQQSIDTMIPFMQAVGLDDETIEDVKVMIRVTDVSTGKSGISPHAYMKQAAKTIQSGKDVSLETLPEELCALASDKMLLQISSILSDADLSPSAATTYDFNQRMSELLQKEIPGMKVGPSSTDFFCKFIVGGEFTSIAGKAQSQSSLTNIMDSVNNPDSAE